MSKCLVLPKEHININPASGIATPKRPFTTDSGAKGFNRI